MSCHWCQKQRFLLSAPKSGYLSPSARLSNKTSFQKTYKEVDRTRPVSQACMSFINVLNL